MSWHRKRKEYDNDGGIDRNKPHHITVKSDGEIDVGCDGKNMWDDCIWEYVLKMIDISVIYWDEYKPETL